MKAATRRTARGAVVQPISRSAIAPVPTIDRTTPLERLPNLLRVPECARWADVSTGVLYAAIKANEIASVKLGRLIRIPRSALAAWIGKSGDPDASAH